MKRKVLSLFCATAMAATAMPVSALAAFNANWFDGTNIENGRVEAEYAANIVESNGTVESKERTDAKGGALLRFGNDKNGEYDENNAPYLKYEVFAEKEGIYTLYAVTSVNPTTGAANYGAWSPYTVTVNGSDTFAFEGTAHSVSGTALGTAHMGYGSGNNQFARYDAPVYLKAGKNEIKFTITDGRPSDGKSQFELDYFTFEYKGNDVDFIKVNAEDAIGGYAKGIASVSDANADGGVYYQVNGAEFTRGDAANAEPVYLDYNVYAPHAGEYVLEFAANHPRAYLSPMSVIINGTDKITNYDSDKLVDGYATNDAGTYNPELSADVLTESDFWKFTSKKTVTLKEGFNTVRVNADVPRKNGAKDQYLIYFDYLKFTPISTDAIEGESGAKTNFKDDALTETASGGTFAKVHDTKNYASIKYVVAVPKDGTYDMYMDMAGYIDVTNVASFAPVKLKVDDNEQFRLNTAGDFFTDASGTKVTLEATVSKEAALAIDDPDNRFDNEFATYKLLTPLTLTKGIHEVSFVIDEAGAHNEGRRFFAIDKFSLVPTTGQTMGTVALKLDTQAIAVGETTVAAVSTTDTDGAKMSKDGMSISYSSSEPGVVTVAEDGTVTANSAGKTVVTVTVEADGVVKEASKVMYVYDAENPFIVIGAVKKGIGVDVETTVGSAAGSTGITTVPTLIAAGYSVIDGVKTTFDDIEKAAMNVNKNTSMTGSNPVVRHNPIELVGKYEKVDVFTWVDIETLVPMFSITEAE